MKKNQKTDFPDSNFFSDDCFIQACIHTRTVMDEERKDEMNM